MTTRIVDVDGKITRVWRNEETGVIELFIDHDNICNLYERLQWCLYIFFGGRLSQKLSFTKDIALELGNLLISKSSPETSDEQVWLAENE